MPLLWSYEELDLRDDVKLALPKGWTVRLFRVTSGDTGKKYHVYRIIGNNGVKISTCDCPEGYFRLPISILGLGDCCKHFTNLEVFLKERKRE